MTDPALCADGCGTLATRHQAMTGVRLRDSSNALIDKAIGGRMWDNRSEAARCANTERPLAHLVDLTDRQDEMKPTREELATALRADPDRFWSKVDKTETCWLWTGWLDRDGYGRMERWMAHRLAYVLSIGPIPEGMTVDHTCFTTACVTPAHLRLLTHNENARLTRRLLQTHCLRGHKLTPENIYSPPANPGRRNCRACGVIRTRKLRAKKNVGKGDSA